MQKNKLTLKIALMVLVLFFMGAPKVQAMDLEEYCAAALQATQCNPQGLPIHISMACAALLGELIGQCIATPPAIPAIPGINTPLFPTPIPLPNPGDDFQPPSCFDEDTEWENTECAAK